MNRITHRSKDLVLCDPGRENVNEVNYHVRRPTEEERQYHKRNSRCKLPFLDLGMVCF